MHFLQSKNVCLVCYLIFLYRILVSRGTTNFRRWNIKCNLARLGCQNKVCRYQNLDLTYFSSWSSTVHFLVYFLSMFVLFVSKEWKFSSLGNLFRRVWTHDSCFCDPRFRCRSNPGSKQCQYIAYICSGCKFRKIGPCRHRTEIFLEAYLQGKNLNIILGSLN